MIHTEIQIIALGNLLGMAGLHAALKDSEDKVLNDDEGTTPLQVGNFGHFAYFR